MTKRFDIQFLRAICVMIVVLFHTLTRYNHPLLVSSVPDAFMSFIGNAIWLAVPMFIFISGFLYSGQIKRQRYSSWYELFKEKSLHILTPYFVFSVLIMLCTNSFNIKELISGEFWHLWFLPMLFCCFVIYFPAFRVIYISCKTAVWELVMLVVSFAFCYVEIPHNIIFVGIDNFFKWGFYFVLGMTVSNHYQKINTLFRTYHLWIPLIIMWLMNISLTHTPYRVFSWHNTFAVSCAIVCIFYFVSKIRISNSRFSFMVLSLANVSMGVYILHYWILIYATSSTAYRFIGLFEPCTGLYVSVAVTFISIFVLIFSYILTRMILRINFGRILLG